MTMKVEYIYFKYNWQSKTRISVISTKFQDILPVDVALPILLHRKDHGLLQLIYTAQHGLQNAEQSPHQIHGTSNRGHNHNKSGTCNDDHENCPKQNIKLIHNSIYIKNPLVPKIQNQFLLILICQFQKELPLSRSHSLHLHDET